MVKNDSYGYGLTGDDYDSVAYDAHVPICEIFFECRHDRVKEVSI